MEHPKTIPFAAQPIPRLLHRAIFAEQWLTGLLLWAAFALFLGLVQFSTPNLPDNDGFYHIKLAYLMRTEGLKPAFTWLPLSILNSREFYDHHFLFHVALIPFTFGDLLAGAKWAAVIFASLAFLSGWNLLKNQGIPYAGLWALGLAAVSEAFIYRMSIPRAQSLSLAVLLLGLDWLLRGKRLRLGMLAFVYVWLYDAFPLLGVLAAVHAASTWLLERRFDPRLLLAVALGTLLGLVINPYFPYNLVFTAHHLLPKLLEATAVQVGNEWYPYDTAQLLRNSPLALAAFASGALALGLSGRRLSLAALTGLVLTCLFGLMLMQSRRFIEYFAPFALVFAAFAWAPLLQTTTQRGLARRLPVLLLALVLLAGGAKTLVDAQASIGKSKPYRTYAEASEWLAANTPAGARVFQTDWDDFPRLFFYNTHNTYLIGLDPTYMQIYDDDLYQRWVQIVQGKVKHPSEAIAGEFGARYILTDLKHTRFLQQARADPDLVETYRDEYAAIFQVVGQP